MSFFNWKFRKDKAIGAQAGLGDSLQKVIDILDNIEGIGGVKITKEGVDWRVSLDATAIASGGSGGGIPTGYGEETLNVVTDGKIITRTVLTKNSGKADVATWSTADVRLLLQVNADGKLRIDKGYLKS
mgnify:CR=1 FL=1